MLIEESDAAPEVRAVYEDIKTTRQVDRVNNFWKALAAHPPTLRRTWESVKEVMAPGALDPLVKEMLYVAVSVTNGCEYCIASHTAAARAKGTSSTVSCWQSSAWRTRRTPWRTGSPCPWTKRSRR